MTKSMRAGEDITEPTHSLTAPTAVSHAQEAQHSALPWRIEMDGNGQANVYGADDQWIGLMPHQCLGSLETLMHANAAFIVHTVNHHEALLDALRTFCGDYESTPTTSDTSLKAAYLHALEVIANAEEK